MTSAKNPDDMDEEELASFYEAHKGDVSLWRREPLKIRSRRGKGPTTSFAVRLAPAELEELQAAAAQDGVTLSEFIRRSSLAAARTEASSRRLALTALRDEVKRIGAVLDTMVKTSS